MTVEVRVHENRFDVDANAPLVTLHETKFMGVEGRIATDFIGRWGMIAGEPDGEDSAGRAKGRLLTPGEVVDRAVEMTELLMKSAKEKGWMVEGPDVRETDQMLEEKEAIKRLTEEAQKDGEYS